MAHEGCGARGASPWAVKFSGAPEQLSRTGAATNGVGAVTSASGGLLRETGLSRLPRIALSHGYRRVNSLKPPPLTASNRRILAATPLWKAAPGASKSQHTVV